MTTPAPQQDNAEPGEVALSRAQRLIVDQCDSLKQLLLSKNRAYGNSALDPARVFSQANPIEQLAVRIDDKISRIRNKGGLVAALADNEHGEDTVQDLIGYLILARVARVWSS